MKEAETNEGNRTQTKSINMQKKQEITEGKKKHEENEKNEEERIKDEGNRTEKNQ